MSPMCSLNTNTNIISTVTSNKTTTTSLNDDDSNVNKIISTDTINSNINTNNSNISTNSNVNKYSDNKINNNPNKKACLKFLDNANNSSSSNTKNTIDNNLSLVIKRKQQALIEQKHLLTSHEKTLNEKSIYLEKNFSSSTNNRPASASSSSVCSSYSSTSSSPSSSQTSFLLQPAHNNNNNNSHRSNTNPMMLVSENINSSLNKELANLTQLNIINSLKNTSDNFSSLASVATTALNNNSMVFKSSIRAKKVKFRLKLSLITGSKDPFKCSKGRRECLIKIITVPVLAVENKFAVNFNAFKNVTS